MLMTSQNLSKVFVSRVRNTYPQSCHQLYKRLQYASATSQADRIQRALQAKSDAGLSYDDLADKLGVTNTYAAQLLLGQAKLTENTAEKLRKVLPGMDEADIQAMTQTFPMRTYDDSILKEPHVYR
jgi:cyanate lyase